MEGTPRRGARKRVAEQNAVGDPGFQSTSGAGATIQNTVSDESQNSSDGKEQLSSPETPSNQRLGFNYFLAKRARKALNFESGSLKIANLKETSRFEEKFKFRVSSKSPLEKTKNRNVDTFTVTAFDGADDISVIAFGNAARKHYSSFEVNHVYEMSKFCVQKSTWEHAVNKLELKLYDYSTLIEASDGDISPISFEFVKPLSLIQGVDENSRIDVIGVLVNDWGLQTIAKATGSLFKRDLALADTDDISVNNTMLTLWGTSAQEFQGQVGSVIVIRKALVETFNEMRKLSVTQALLLVDPAWPSIAEEVNGMKKWFEEADAMELD